MSCAYSGRSYILIMRQTRPKISSSGRSRLWGTCVFWQHLNVSQPFSFSWLCPFWQTLISRPDLVTSWWSNGLDSGASTAEGVGSIPLVPRTHPNAVTKRNKQMTELICASFCIDRLQFPCQFTCLGHPSHQTALLLLASTLTTLWPWINHLISSLATYICEVKIVSFTSHIITHGKPTVWVCSQYVNSFSLIGHPGRM